MHVWRRGGGICSVVLLCKFKKLIMTTQWIRTRKGTCIYQSINTENRKKNIFPPFLCLASSATADTTRPTRRCWRMPPWLTSESSAPWLTLVVTTLGEISRWCFSHSSKTQNHQLWYDSEIFGFYFVLRLSVLMNDINFVFFVVVVYYFLK